MSESADGKGFTAKRVAELGPLDAVVIGSGIGSLTTAALLARVGWRVLVLEQHGVAGGAMHTFTQKNSRGAWEFDAGVNCASPAATNPLPYPPTARPAQHTASHLARASRADCGAPFAHSRVLRAITRDAIAWCAMNDDYDVATIASTASDRVASDPAEPVAMCGDRARLLARLDARFPADAKAVRRFYRACGVAAGVAWLPVVLLKLLPRAIARALEARLGALVQTAGAPREAVAAARSAGAPTTGDVLAACGVSEECAGALTFQWGDLGLPPAEQPFVLHALNSTHWQRGSWYPRGGGSVIPRAIVATIEARGGAVLVRAPVEKILLDKNDASGWRATGVRVRGVDVRARVVISGAGVYNTLTRFLGAADAPPDAVVTDDQGLTVSKPAVVRTPSSEVGGMPPDLAELRRALFARPAVEQPVAGEGPDLPLSCTWMCLFIGLDASSAELELPSSNRWVVPSWAHDANVAESRAGGAAAPLSAVFIEFPSSKDDRWEERANLRPLWKALDESGAEAYKRAGACCQVLAPCDYEWFARFDARAQAGVSEDANGGEGKPVRASARLHREEYGAMKAELTERLLAITLEQFPSMAGHVVHTELGTPLSMNTYLGSTRGELYGLAHGASRFSGRFQRLLRPETPIRGLYLTGQDVLLQGLWGAMMSGVLTVIAVSKARQLPARDTRARAPPAPDTASHPRLSAQLAFLRCVHLILLDLALGTCDWL